MANGQIWLGQILPDALYIDDKYRDKKTGRVNFDKAHKVKLMVFDILNDGRISAIDLNKLFYVDKTNTHWVSELFYKYFYVPIRNQIQKFKGVTLEEMSEFFAKDEEAFFKILFNNPDRNIKKLDEAYDKKNKGMSGDLLSVVKSMWGTYKVTNLFFVHNINEALKKKTK